MKKILYLMHIPWGWLKQRPHFFAEYLSEYFLVDVRYRKANTVSNKKLLTPKLAFFTNLSIKGFNQIPFHKLPILKNCRLNWINSFIANLQIHSIKKYDYIWITSPMLYYSVSPLLRKEQIIIYDCMDDMLEFPNIKYEEKRRIAMAEHSLLKEADYVFVSSEYLMRKILSRANLEREHIYVVNNAIELPSLSNCTYSKDIAEKLSYIRSLSFPFMYIGMVSKWFDFGLVMEALNKFPQINIVLVGPCDVKLVKHNRLHYLGIVERTHIFSLMQEAYALIMPFVLNELICSVNPVKLYEYIYTGKPTMSIRYGETEKFNEFVYLYSNKNEFLVGLENILSKPHNYIQTREKIQEFILHNTWKARCEQIAYILKS